MSLAANHKPDAAPDYLSTMQQSSTDSSNKWLNPLPVLTLKKAVATTGMRKLGIKADTDGLLMTLEVPTDHNNICVAAIGIGEMNVIKAEDLDKIEGGKIKLNATNIKLYHATSTPQGDVSTSLTTSTLTVCPK